MANRFFIPRKQRTREHIIADQSLNHLERFIIDAGHTAQRTDSDYGYDLILFTYDGQGCIEPDSLFFHLKAGETLRAVGSDYVFDVDIRDYNLWMYNKLPVVLVLFDASRRRAYWLAFQRYFHEDARRRPKQGARTVRVRVPKRQVVNRRAIAKIRELKREVRDWPAGELP